MSAAPGTPKLDFARKLIEHCCWEDERVWKLAVDPLTDEQFVREVEFGLGSIQRECAHVLETEWTNLRRLRGEPAPEALIQDFALDRTAMRARWLAIHADWTAYMGELDADLFFADCAFHDGDRDVKLKAW